MDLLWFLWDTQQCNDDALSLAISIAWAMWTRRNWKRNGKKFMTNSLLVLWVGQFISDFKVVNVKSPLEFAKYSYAWNMPTDVVFKVNVDAAIFSSQHMCGVGVVIRDEMGLVVGALSKRLKVVLLVKGLKFQFPIKKKKGVLSYNTEDVPLDWSISNCVVYSAFMDDCLHIPFP